MKPSQGRQKRKDKERPKDELAPWTKKKEKANPSLGRKLFHLWPPLMSHACKS